MITLDIFLAVGRSQVCTFSSWTIRSLATHVNAAQSFLRGNCWREHLRQSHRIQSFRWAHPKSCRWGMPDMSRQLSRCFFFLAAWYWTLWVCSSTFQGGKSQIGLIVLHHTTASVVPALNLAWSCTSFQSRSRSIPTQWQNGHHPCSIRFFQHHGVPQLRGT